MIQKPEYPRFAGSIGVELDSGTFAASQVLCCYRYISKPRQGLSLHPASARSIQEDLTPSRRIQRQRHILHKRLVIFRLNTVKHLQHPNEKEHCLRECKFLCETKPSSASFESSTKKGKERMRNHSRPIHSRGPPPKGTKAQPGLKPSSHRSGLNSFASSP